MNMASNILISRVLGDLIQRISKVKVCEEHLKLVSASLMRLQQLFMSTYVEDHGYPYESLKQTLKTIDDVISGCGENEAMLEGMTYQDLESVLLRLQLRLVQHEADLTDDYEAKVQILSNTHYEQQILVQTVFKEKMRQRLETIEQHTIEYTKEQLRLLREKHFDIIKVYLQRCTELHKSVPLTGLTGEVVAKVARTLYKISVEDQTQLEQNWQGCELPLTRTFIQFKPDKSTSFERNASRRLLVGAGTDFLQGPQSKKEAGKRIWDQLVSAPYMMSMVERDRYSQEEDVNEETIIRTKRWIVILGDPGSGKTSFVRWLVRHLAQTLLLNGQHSSDYGPLRIPILIRIGEFAEMLNAQPSLTLFDYIGKHKWMGHAIVDDASISVDNLSWALQDYIRYGQALIILDGLDEIPVSDQRSRIINIVETFVDTYVQTPTRVSVFDNPQLSRLFDDPSRSGGNQLLVTSRIVGYHAAPLAGQFAHYSIRPMNMEHMKDFVDYWFFRVHQRILDTLNLTVANLGESQGEALQEELAKIENVGLLDVASNSCLMAFVCCVAFSQVEGSPLPAQRIRLYEEIINSMLSLWSCKSSTISMPEVVRILGDIATYIHGNSASGLIHEEKMREVCIQSIKASMSKSTLTQEDLQNQTSDFVRIIREDVGILAARGESLYGFLHLTFQEYFTCLKLIDVDKLKEENLINHKYCEDEVQLVAQSLRHHMNDPRFRVPIALALGKISSTWPQIQFDQFCYEFCQERDETHSVLPLGAYVLITSGNDLVNYPSEPVLFDALDRLMIAAGRHTWSLVCPFLLDQITMALKKFRNDIVSLWINNFFARSPSHDIQTISALCHLIEGQPHEFDNVKWLSQLSCSTLQSLSTLDSENNGFAIDRLLVKIALSNHRLLPVDPTTFKGYLITEEIELRSIPISVLPLIIALYGGLKRNGTSVVFDPAHIYRESTAVTRILVHFLSQSNLHIPDEQAMLIKQECLRSLQTRIECHDHSSETVDICIATICLCGIHYLRDNMTTIPNSILHISLNRLKYISFTLRQFYFTGDENDLSIENATTKFISKVIKRCVLGESSPRLFLDLLHSLKSGIARLRSSKTSTLLKGESTPDKRILLMIPNSFRKEYAFLNAILSIDVQFYSGHKSCSLLPNFSKLFWVLEHNDKFDTQYRMAVAMDTIPAYLLFRHDEDLLFPLTFVPAHLQTLYLRLLEQGYVVISANDSIVNRRPQLCFEHILTECLMLLSNTSCKRLSLTSALISLLPRLRTHSLANFGSSILWPLSVKNAEYLAMFDTISRRAIDYETGAYIDKLENFPGEDDMAGEERRKLIERCIDEECQRLQDALANSDSTSMKTYSACVSLARICRWTQDENRLHLLEKSVQGAMSIKNKLILLDALCVIGLCSCSAYDRIQVNNHRSLQEEIRYQLHQIYPDLPVLLHTAILIRCLPLLHHQQTIDCCLQNLFNKLNDVESRDQQVVYEALSPYLRSSLPFLQHEKPISNNFTHSKTTTNKPSALHEYFKTNANGDLCFSLLLSNMYLGGLASELDKSVADDDLQLLLSQINLSTTDTPIGNALCQLQSSILTVEQTIIVTTILSSVSSSNRSEYIKTIYSPLSDILHRFNLAEFKACRLLECWMNWNDSNDLCVFAWHAALLLTTSDLWSVKAATIICDLLCCDNDRFRQRAEMILRSKNNQDDIRTSSKLGIDVLLTLAGKQAHYHHTSPSANLSLLRMFENTTVDVRSHLDIFLWLDRYRIYSLVKQNDRLEIPRSSPILRAISYLPIFTSIDVSFCDNICHISNDLMQYVCDLITSNFSIFLEIDGDTTSNIVLESHTQFVVSVLVFLLGFAEHNDEMRPRISHALIVLIKTSRRNEIHRAAAYAFGCVCDNQTSKILFNQLQLAVDEEENDTFSCSDSVLGALILGYCYWAHRNDINFNQDDMNLFKKLLQHSSQYVLKAVHVGLSRVVKDKSLLFEMLNSDHIQCYHALVHSSASLATWKNSQNCVNYTADFIEQHPNLLSIFVVELYQSIRHFTSDVLYMRTIDYCLAYGRPRYVDIASLLAVRMPAAFCAFIKDWHDGENLKRALFYTSKQHNYAQRASSLIILSVFGELTVELCEMIIKALRDDPHIQNMCYKCLTRINTIKDERIVFSLLYSYLKSKSMNVRYATAKILLHLSRSSLIPSNQVQTLFHELMLDPSSNEDLWLIEEQDDVVSECVYYYAGTLKEAIYSLLVGHLTNDSSGVVRRNELNNIDADFVQSEKAVRLASCLYENKTEENFPCESSSEKIKSVE